MIIFLTGFRSHEHKIGLTEEQKKKLKATFINAFDISKENWNGCYLQFRISDKEIEPYVKDVRYWNEFRKTSQELVGGEENARD